MTKWMSSRKYPKGWALSKDPIPAYWNNRKSKFSFFGMKIGDKITFKDIKEYNSARSMASRIESKLILDKQHVRFKGSWLNDKNGGYGTITRIE